jgi:hypothetical protein
MKSQQQNTCEILLMSVYQKGIENVQRTERSCESRLNDTINKETNYLLKTTKNSGIELGATGSCL